MSQAVHRQPASRPPQSRAESGCAATPEPAVDGTPQACDGRMAGAHGATAVHDLPASRRRRRPGEGGPTVAVGQQRGAALLTVLWVVLVLMVIVTGMATGTRREAQLTGNLMDAADLRGRARAGITLALQDLSRPGGERRFIADGRWYDERLLGGAVRIAVQDERGRVDINAASGVILSGLFRQAGLADGTAAAVAQNVRAWRRGGREAGGGRPFHSVDELQRLPGVGAELFRRIFPVITVHGRGNRPAPDWAPPLALAAYPGMSLEEARRWVDERAHQRSIGAQPPPFPASAPGSQGRAGVYTLRAVAVGEGGARGLLEATIRMTRLADTPYQILEWRQAPPGTAHW